MSTIRVMIFEPGSGMRTGGAELLGIVPATPGAWVWADFDTVERGEERKLLQSHFGLQLLAVQDAQRERHPPKHELFGDTLFLLLRELSDPELGSDDPRFTHVAIFAAEKFLVTRRNRPSPSIEETWKSSTVEQLERGPAHIVYRISRAIVDRYTPLVLSMEERLGTLEDRMFEAPSDRILEELADYNRILKKLRRTFTYQHGMMQQVARGDEGVLVLFDDHEFNDIYENMERLASLCQLNQELAVDLLNTYLSVSAHRLNQIMRVLTIATVIFLPLGLLAGVYGMNFEYMPELSWRYSYFVVVGTMLGVALTLITIFKIKKWL
ncbi:MAG: magnesium transporter CorA family protein [Gammaproteobacteria bacterium]|nr:magnesium transporter CorA family protein [Gammaproteobacteria bacterium]